MREIERLLACLVLSRTGSYRSATREIGQSFKALSGKVAELESKLGFPVFHKTRNGVVVTTEGEAVIAAAAEIENGLQRLRQLAKSLLNSNQSEVIIGASAGIGMYWIMPRIVEFHKKFPLVRLRVVANDQAIGSRRAGIDISLQYDEPSSPETVRVKVAKVHLVLCASDKYLSVHGTPRVPGDLAGHRFVFLNPGWFDQKALIEVNAGRALPASQILEVGGTAEYFLAVEHGAGIGLVPTFIFAADSTLRVIDVEVHYSIDFWMCYAADARLNPRLNETIKWLIELFEPRFNPWFRREFIHPAEFPALIARLGIRDALERHRFSHSA